MGHFLKPSSLYGPVRRSRLFERFPMELGAYESCVCAPAFHQTGKRAPGGVARRRGCPPRAPPYLFDPAPGRSRSAGHLPVRWRTSIMLHLGTVLRVYYDRLLPVPINGTSDPDADPPREPPITLEP